MRRTPTLEDLAAQLAAQDTLISEAILLSRSVPPGVLLPESELSALHEATEPVGCTAPFATLGIRA